MFNNNNNHINMLMLHTTLIFFFMPLWSMRTTEESKSNLTLVRTQSRPLKITLHRSPTQRTIVIPTRNVATQTDIIDPKYATTTDPETLLNHPLIIELCKEYDQKLTRNNERTLALLQSYEELSRELRTKRESIYKLIEHNQQLMKEILFHKSSQKELYALYIEAIDLLKKVADEEQ